MLSINIPVYNIKVSDLVHQLVKQANALVIDFEIRVYDDGSMNTVRAQNKQLDCIPNVIYREMQQNMGRAIIRNKMGLDSKKSFLLFIDADSNIISEQYLERYIKLAVPECVVCGGTAYAQQKPAQTIKMLRWVYGCKREAISAEERNNKKEFIITSNNFMIDRLVFKRIHFRENLDSYGHEDTLLGYDLCSAGIRPVNIDNPVLHTGLEDSNIFLKKTRKALENLLFISEKILYNSPEFNRRVNFLKQYNKITSVIPSVLLRLFFDLFHKAMKKNLTEKNPCLFWFDVYRLCYFAKLKRVTS